MKEILAITEAPERDQVLLAELALRDADKVTILMPGCRPEADTESSNRLAELVARAEFVTDATVVGMGATEVAIERSDFDDVIHAGAPSQPSLLERLGITLTRRGASRSPLRPALH